MIQKEQKDTLTKTVKISSRYMNIGKIDIIMEDIVLYRKYSPEIYPKYENYDAINVDRYTEIPCDYDGIMGVPITFIDKYNP